MNSNFIVERVMKDLGVCVDDTLKFLEHISNITSSASRLMGLFQDILTQMY